MIKHIISLILLIVSVLLSLRHGWSAFQPPTPQQAEMISILGVSKNTLPYFGAFSILIGLLLLFPKTFFISNLMHAFTILVIMALSLRAGNFKIALIEIPFLALPLILIWLKYPFKN